MAFLNGRKKLFIILEPSILARLHAAAPALDCTEIFAQRRHSAYLCQDSR